MGTKVLSVSLELEWEPSVYICFHSNNSENLKENVSREDFLLIILFAGRSSQRPK